MLAGEMLQRIEIDACVGHGVFERRGPQLAEAIAGLGVGRALEVANDGARRGAQNQSRRDTVDRVGKRDRGVQGRDGRPGDSRDLRFGTVPGARFSSIAVTASTVRRALSTAAANETAALFSGLNHSQADHHDQRERPTRRCGRLRAGRTPLLSDFRGRIKIREHARPEPGQNPGAQVLAQH